MTIEHTHALHHAVSTTDPDAIAIPLRSGAYHWWYFDVTSDDGSHTLVVIFLVGSVFSPWYFDRLVRNEKPLPLEHVAVHAALYERGRPRPVRFAFTEHRDSSVPCTGDLLCRTGGSSLSRRADGEYEIILDEMTPRFPLALPIRGRVRFRPQSALFTRPLMLSPGGVHHWIPVAPSCRVDVNLDIPHCQFHGSGYHDVNAGTEPLGHAFRHWTWARVHDRDATRIAYDRTLVSGERHRMELSLSHMTRHADAVHDLQLTQPERRSRSAWLLREPDALYVGTEQLTEVTRIEGSPFYARYRARDASDAAAVAEHVDLAAFADPRVRKLVWFRCRRV